MAIITVLRGPHAHQNGGVGVSLSGGFYTVGNAYQFDDGHRDATSLLHHGWGREATPEEVSLFKAATSSPQEKKAAVEAHIQNPVEVKEEVPTVKEDLTIEPDQPVANDKIIVAEKTLKSDDQKSDKQGHKWSKHRR